MQVLLALSLSLTLSPSLHLVTESEQEPCWEFLLSEQNGEQEEQGRGPADGDPDRDGLLFEFSSEPLLPCYHVQVSLTQG